MLIIPRKGKWTIIVPTQGILCSKELSTSVDEKSCFFNSYLIIRGYLGSAMKAGTPGHSEVIYQMVGSILRC